MRLYHSQGGYILSHLARSQPDKRSPDNFGDNQSLDRMAGPAQISNLPAFAGAHLTMLVLRLNVSGKHRAQCTLIKCPLLLPVASSITARTHPRLRAVHST